MLNTPTYQFSDSIQDPINDGSSDGVVASGEVVCGILFSADQLLWMKQFTRGACTDLI